MTGSRHTGARHRDAIVAALAGGAMETIDVAAAAKISRQSAAAALRALSAAGVVVEALRRRSRKNRGHDAIVWKLPG